MFYNIIFFSSYIRTFMVVKELYLSLSVFKKELNFLTIIFKLFSIHSKPSSDLIGKGLKQSSNEQMLIL